MSSCVNLKALTDVEIITQVATSQNLQIFFLRPTQELILVFGIVLRPVTNCLDVHVTYLVLRIKNTHSRYIYPGLDHG